MKQIARINNVRPYTKLFRCFCMANKLHGGDEYSVVDYIEWVDEMMYRASKDIKYTTWEETTAKSIEWIERLIESQNK